MRYSDIYKDLIAGKKVTRASWPAGQFVTNEMFIDHPGLNSINALPDDWAVLDDE